MDLCCCLLASFGVRYYSNRFDFADSWTMQWNWFFFIIFFFDSLLFFPPSSLSRLRQIMSKSCGKKEKDEPKQRWIWGKWDVKIQLIQKTSVLFFESIHFRTAFFFSCCLLFHFHCRLNWSFNNSKWQRTNEYICMKSHKYIYYMRALRLYNIWKYTRQRTTHNAQW